MGTDQPWRPVLFLTSTGDCPVCEYIRSETDRKVQAKIIRKAEHLAAVGPGNQNHLLWDTVAGPIKELRVDKQVRILFSWEEGPKWKWVFLLAGTRKKNGKIDPKVVAQAERCREEWLAMKKPRAKPLEAFQETL